MQDVAADGDDEALDAALAAADGQGVEQRLGRMFMLAVAGIDHRAADFLGEQLDRAGGGMAHHQDVGMHGVAASWPYRAASRPWTRPRFETAMFMTSAPSRFPASSKELWVRVEASKKRLIWVRPLSVDVFLSLCRDSFT